ncbi:hypothetical protein H5410_056871 [Solanum commersonii]|uniref:Uncharacterized protein n=1 Tax=Solanum commersonii TaxID=4109 RepID=A0A9J5WLE1_SOLCO|nr:hypothetical protein H5410_056871 [Solanum commersonii]
MFFTREEENIIHDANAILLLLPYSRDDTRFDDAYYYVALWFTIMSYTEEEHVSLPSTNKRNIKKVKSLLAR